MNPDFRRPLRQGLLPRLRLTACALACISVLTACGDDSSDNPSPTAQTSGDGSGAVVVTGSGISGKAYLGPLIGATASLYGVNADGSNAGEAVETVTSSDTGFVFTKAVAGTGRICVTGGSYLDEATQASQTNTTTLCALFSGEPSKVFVTPISTFVDAAAKGYLKAHPGATLDAALAAANALIKGTFNLSADVNGIEPSFTPTDAIAAPDAYRVGAVLGGYSQLLKDYLLRCGGDRHAVLDALFQDISDSIFDGKSLDQAGAQVTALLSCGGKTINLPVGAGTADLVTALTEFAGTDAGIAMDFAGHRDVVDNVKASVVGGPAAPSQIKVLPSQGLIAIDTKNNIGYVPIYTKDSSGNAQIAVVDLTVGAANPVIKTIPLAGSTTAIASNFYADGGRVYALASNNSGKAFVYVIKTSDYTVETSVEATGVSFSGQFGGVIVDTKRLQVVVAGTSEVGLLDISAPAPVWKANSVVNVNGTDSISLNSETGQLFISSDGDKKVVDTTVSPMTARVYTDNLGTTDGVAYDNLTGLMIITPEFQDLAYVINMNELSTTGPLVAPTLMVPGVGFSNPVGEGPGGQVAVNVLTHQALVADEFGHNLRLVQMPLASITGAPVATNTFTIAATTLPKPLIGGTPTQLGMRGDPNSVTIDPARNFGYVLADTQPYYHGFNVDLPLFLVRVDLSSATTAAGVNWQPSMQAIRLP